MTGNVETLTGNVETLTGNVETLTGNLYDFLNNYNEIKSLAPTGWFSTQTYSISNGIYTIWYERNDPGIKWDLNFIGSGLRSTQFYIIFRAKAITNASTRDNVRAKFRTYSTASSYLTDMIYINLTYDWQTFIIPFTFEYIYDYSTAFALLQIDNSAVGNKIMIDNPRIYYSLPEDNTNLTNLLLQLGFDVFNKEQINSCLKGQIPNFPSVVESLPVEGYHFVTPKNKIAEDNQYIEYIYTYLPNKTTVNFKVGYIDQYMLITDVSSFSLELPEGFNKYKVKDLINIPAGAQLFMDISGIDLLYNSTNTEQYYKLEKVYVQDETHTIDTSGYSGMIMYESDYLIPFAYSVREKNGFEKIEELQNKTSNLENSISDIEDQIGGMDFDSDFELIAPNGNKYFLQVTNEGNLVATPKIPNKVFVMGNSLTLGFGTFGMAASDSKHDYFYYVNQYLLEKNPDLIMTRTSGSSWEGQTSSEGRLLFLENTIKPNCDEDCDLVIIQLVDNVNTDEKRATFPEDAKSLVEWVRKRCPKARVLWVASWYAHNLFQYVETACKERGAEIVDVRTYATQSQYKSAIGNKYTDDSGVEHEITSSGVASHPGDLGMEKIAEEIIKVLNI